MKKNIYINEEEFSEQYLSVHRKDIVDIMIMNTSVAVGRETA